MRLDIPISMINGAVPDLDIMRSVKAGSPQKSGFDHREGHPNATSRQ